LRRRISPEEAGLVARERSEGRRGREEGEVGGEERRLYLLEETTW
jgi:hypothetical protein